MMKAFWVGVAGVALSLVATLVSGQEPAGRNTSSPETGRLIDSVDGSALYKAYCAVCHGSDGRGGGPMALSLKASPADLTKIAMRNGGAFPNARVERIIAGEETIPGGHGTRAMPIWGPIFSQIAWDQDLGKLRVHNLAAYLNRLQTP